MSEDKPFYIITALLVIIIIMMIFLLTKVENQEVILNTSHNNFQATHTASIKPYVLPKNNEYNMYCFNIDEWGELFGSSMQPTFFEGNTALFKHLDADTVLKTGDIIRFYRLDSEHPTCESLKLIIAKDTLEDYEPNITNNSLGGRITGRVDNEMAVIHRINAIYDGDILVQGDNLDEQEVIQRCQITSIVVGILYT